MYFSHSSYSSDGFASVFVTSNLSTEVDAQIFMPISSFWQ